MKNTDKYRPSDFAPPKTSMDWTKKTRIERVPTWCSVDLRDGNQSLVIPMNIEEKLEFFDMLVDIGFREIEVGYPAASETEFLFVRRLIDEGRIPDNVTIQVLTQSRAPIIERTFQAISGAKNAIVHFYNSTSKAQREQVFNSSVDDVVALAVEGARLVLASAEGFDGNIRFQYSPESFSGTEPEIALKVCNAVINKIKPTSEKKLIINLPETVSLSMPHLYASQVEYICENIDSRENVVISLHTHNDRGCGVADTELALLAGADRVEGTLFGNGERTGNVDLITLALNLYSQGIDPLLDFSDMPSIAKRYERLTRMQVYERSPYAGALVFAAFSGSHQDAIAKAMKNREKKGLYHWDIPYLPIDPRDVGREYETDTIRINSQSGKGGIGYLLEQNFGFNLPNKMRENLGYAVKSVSDRESRELSADEIFNIFKERYLDIENPLSVPEVEYIKKQEGKDKILAVVSSYMNGVHGEYTGRGNGRLDAVANAIIKGLKREFKLIDYSEHALESGSYAAACAYVELSWSDGESSFGAGTDSDILTASVKALQSAINSYLKYS